MILFLLLDVLLCAGNLLRWKYQTVATMWPIYFAECFVVVSMMFFLLACFYK